MFMDKKPDAKLLKDEIIGLAATLGLKLVEDDPLPYRRQGNGTSETRTSPVNTPPQTGIAPERLTVANAWINAIAARDKVLGQDLFSDPAWNILLDLYVNQCRNQKVSVTSLCLASKAPATTALRWIGLLEDRGFIEKWGDASDRRRVFVLLTEEGCSKIESALDRASDSDKKLGLSRMRFTP